MKLPKQVPAVERKINKEAALPAGAGVRPASIWDTIGDAIRVAGPLIEKLTSS